MAFGDITVTLRPIKFAFLVNPAERGILDRVVEASLFQWGGLHNPIIPIFRRLPTYWSDLPSRKLAPSEICSGYLRMFDPDAVIVCGNVDKSVVPSHIEHIHTLDEFVGDLSKEDSQSFGVGLFELLAHFAESEFKYSRRDEMKVLMPTYDAAGSTLFKAVIGEIPAQAKRETYRQLLKRIEIDQPHVTIDTFLQVIRHPQRFLLSAICAENLGFRRPRTERSLAAFLMNHTNALDIIDFWNLRALGWHVLPIPLKLAGEADTATFVQGFIDRQRSLNQAAPGVTDVAILKARSVTDQDFNAFINSVPRTAGHGLTVQTWYPPMWDEFTRRGGRLTCSDISAGQDRTEVSDEKARGRIKALAPTVMAANLGHGPRYANDIRISMYGQSEFGAEVLPPYEKSVARLFGIGLLTDWRAGPSGPTYLGRYADATIHLNQPSPRDVVSTVLAARGWTDFEFSSSGNVAYQMMKNLGGPYQIGLLRNLLLIKFLESLATGGDPEQEEKIARRIDAKLKTLAGQAEQVPLADAKKVVREEIGKLTGVPFPTKDVEEQEFFKNINRIANSRRFPLDAGTLVERYTKARIFNLGVRVQCSVCDQRSWYPLELVKSELQCPICLSQFELPTHNPRNEIKWSYKSLGPFALPKQGFGAYSVLLTVLFLSDWQRPATTPIFSFRANHAGKELEADFMMFYRSATYWDRETETIFGECKSFNGFTEKDIRRMTALAEDNPDAILVFATLAPQLSDRDKRLLTPFVKKIQKVRKAGSAEKSGTAAYRDGIVLGLWPAAMLAGCRRANEGLRRFRAADRRPFDLMRRNATASSWPAVLARGLDCCVRPAPEKEKTSNSSRCVVSVATQGSATSAAWLTRYGRGRSYHAIASA